VRCALPAAGRVGVVVVVVVSAVLTKLGTPRLLLRIRTSLKRLEPSSRELAAQRPADPAWHDMLQRADLADRQRRLAAAEAALNALASSQDA